MARAISVDRYEQASLRHRSWLHRLIEIEGASADVLLKRIASILVAHQRDLLIGRNDTLVGKEGEEVVFGVHASDRKPRGHFDMKQLYFECLRVQV